jgi:hypothetical protein
MHRARIASYRGAFGADDVRARESGAGNPNFLASRASRARVTEKYFREIIFLYSHECPRTCIHVHAIDDVKPTR